MSLKKRYDKLFNDREPYLRRARESSKLTIPTLIPPRGHNPTSTLPTPYQGLGARGVNTLAAKLALILLPAGDPFFKFSIDEFVAEQLDESGKKGEIEKTLAKIERSILRAINVSSTRVPLNDAVKHLIVGGNVLLGYQGPEKRLRVWYLNQYVQHYTPDHILLEIIIKEETTKSALDEDIIAATQVHHLKDDDKVDIYTGIKRVGPDEYEVWQEVNDKDTGRKHGKHSMNNLPYLSLGWNWIDGEDYARGHVEEYYGDLKSLEELSKAIVEGSAAAAKVLFFVKAGGQTSVRVFKKPNGSAVTGDANDVSVLQLDKSRDFSVAQSAAQEIAQRLSFAFLMQQAIQRDAERVTAEEIRRVAEDIDDTLGGIFSQLAEDLQIPLVRLVQADLEAEGTLPQLPDDTVDTEILTGLEALGRSAEVSKLQAWFTLIPEPLLQQLLPRFNVDELVQRLGAAVNLDTNGLLMSEEEAAQITQNAQLNELLQNAGPEVIKQITQSLLNQQQGQGNIPNG